MNGEFPSNNPRAELEARLTAFILGELSAHEAAALRQAMDEDAELAALYERLKAASKLVREAAANPIEQAKEPPVPLRLSGERRQKLLAQFKTVAPKEFVRASRQGITGRRLLEIAAVLALLGILAGMLLPALSKAKSKAVRVNVYNNLKQIELAKKMWADDNNKSPNDAPTASDLASDLGGNGGLPKSINGETYIIGKLGEPPTAITKDGRRISLNGDVAAVKPSQGVLEEMSRAPLPAPLEHVSVPRPQGIAPALPAKTTIVLPPTEDTAIVTATTLSGYRDTSAEWNPGTGDHIPINYAKATDIKPALQALSDTRATSSNSGISGGAFQNSEFNWRQQTHQPQANDGSVQQVTVNGLRRMGSANFGATSLTNSIAPTGDPDWIGFLEHPDDRHSNSNGFVSRNGFIALPLSEKLDLDHIHNQVGTSSVVANNGLIINQGIGSWDSSNSGFRFYRDINGNGATNAVIVSGPVGAVTGLPVARLRADGSLETNFDPGAGGLIALPQVEMKTKFAEVAPGDNSAPGFNFQAGNTTNFIVASGGTAPSFGNGTGKGSAANPFGLFPGSEYQSANQKELLTDSEVITESGRASSTVSMPADVPGTGHLFKSEANKAGTVVTNNDFARIGGLGRQDQSSGTIPSQELIEQVPAWRTNEIATATLVQDGKLLYEAGKLDEAEGKLKRALGEDPSNAAAFQYLQSVKERQIADATRRSELHSGEAMLQVEKTWDVEQRNGRREPVSNANNYAWHGGALLGPRENFGNATNYTLADSGPPANGWSLSASPRPFYADNYDNAGEVKNDAGADMTFNLTPPPTKAPSTLATNSFVFDDQKAAEKQLGEPSNFESINVVGYVNLKLTNGINLAGNNAYSTKAGIDAGTDYVATNGVYPATAEIGNVTVSIDPETKRVFFITDADTQSVSNIILQLDRTGAQNQRQSAGEQANRSPAYLAKLQELEGLRKAGEVMALKAAQASVEREVPTTPLVEVIEHPDGKPAQSPTLGQRISGALTGKVTETAKIKIERDVTDVPGVAGQPSLSGIYDPYFIQTEFEVIQSEKILDQVIEKLKLNETWAKKESFGTPLKMSEARRLLKDHLQLRAEPNSSVVDIKVKGDEPVEAAKIADTIAEVYADYRRKERQEINEGSGKEFKEEFVAQQKKIAKAEDELAQLVSEPAVQQNDAPLSKPAAPMPVPQPEVTTSENAFSTFSLNIADVSFKLAAASLEKGQMPEPASIRSEEFINAFDYRDPEPAPGAPLGFAWERAQYPFAHNRDLLRFSVKTAAAGREPGRPMNIVLLLDKSGSMERADRVRIIHEALQVLATQLGPEDKLSVVTFARVARLWVDGLPGSQAGEVVDGLDKLTPEGGTNLEEAMRLAYETARRHYIAGGINRVVLLTDGAANLGNVDPESLKQKAEGHRKEGIALDCFGIGWEGYNDDLMEVLSRNGGGRYGFLNTPEEVTSGFAGQLAGALHVAASDVKVQVEFNPKRVTAYRQIGYAKLQLTKEQFRDNMVNAAQVGAAESGNALYAIEVNPNGEGPLATVRVRYKVPGTEDYTEHEWVVPYTGNALPLEQASSAMRLAGAASAFSEVLATSPFADGVTTDQLLGLMHGVPETYGADERPKKLEWMIRQAKSLEEK